MKIFRTLCKRQLNKTRNVRTSDAEMNRPAFVFDGRNILDLAKLKSLGFRVSGIGKQG